MCFLRLLHKWYQFLAGFCDSHMSIGTWTVTDMFLHRSLNSHQMKAFDHYHSVLFELET